MSASTLGPTPAVHANYTINGRTVCVLNRVNVEIEHGDISAAQVRTVTA